MAETVCFCTGTTNRRPHTLISATWNSCAERVDAGVKTPEKKPMERPSLTRDGFRFWLRPCQEGDGDAIYAAADESRARVGKWMDLLTPAYTPRDARGWARAAPADW